VGVTIGKLKFCTLFKFNHYTFYTQFFLDVIAGFTKSPYPEIDDFISSTLKSHSKYGRIRQWTYFNQGELIVYDIVGYRYCHNIEREHKSNNIM
jgi:hypothetical protein